MTALLADDYGLVFEPDPTTLKLLQAEHVNGTWVGRELLPIANRIRNAGGDEGDYRRWVLQSNLWLSYTGSTGDSGPQQRKHLASAWDKSERSRPFELDDALSDLLDRIASARWPGRAGNRNRAVALAFVGFCREHNCFTRTLSRYELAKLTPAISPNTVGKALDALIELGLLMKVDRTDRRSSGRSTGRYKINLFWRAVGNLEASLLRNPHGKSDSMSTGKYSLTRFCQMADTVYELDVTGHDIWTYRGLGQSALRVWELLPEHPGASAFGLDDPARIYEDDSIEDVGKSSADLVGESGLSRRTVDAVLRNLFDHCMVVQLSGKPRRWVQAAYPPVEPIADLLGCAGYIDQAVDKIERRQEANRQAYPSSYTNYQHQKGTTK